MVQPAQLISGRVDQAACPSSILLFLEDHKDSTSDQQQQDEADDWTNYNPNYTRILYNKQTIFGQFTCCTSVVKNNKMHNTIIGDLKKDPYCWA